MCWVAAVDHAVCLLVLYNPSFGSSMWLRGLRRHLFSKTVFTGHGSWFEPGRCQNVFFFIIISILKESDILTNWWGPTFLLLNIHLPGSARQYKYIYYLFLSRQVGQAHMQIMVLSISWIKMLWLWQWITDWGHLGFFQWDLKMFLAMLVSEIKF